jgi:hypothetical protein
MQNTETIVRRIDKPQIDLGLTETLVISSSGRLFLTSLFSAARAKDIFSQDLEKPQCNPKKCWTIPFSRCIYCKSLIQLIGISIALMNHKEHVLLILGDRFSRGIIKPRALPIRRYNREVGRNQPDTRPEFPDGPKRGMHESTKG